MTASLVVATSVDDAVQELAAGACALAGGTDLVVRARQRRAPLPERLVSLHRLDELRGVEERRVRQLPMTPERVWAAKR